jgi:hypothetical protein
MICAIGDRHYPERMHNYKVAVGFILHVSNKLVDIWDLCCFCHIIYMDRYVHVLLSFAIDR